MSDRQQLVSELILKGFLPLAMVCVMMYGAYTFLDRQMTHIEKTQTFIEDVLVKRLDGISEKTFATDERLRNFGERLFKLVQDKMKGNQLPSGTHTIIPQPSTTDQ